MTAVQNIIFGTKVRVPFTLNTGAGGRVNASISLVATDVFVYKDDSQVQKTTNNGITISNVYDSRVGLVFWTADTNIDTGDVGFWEAGSKYMVVLYPATTTVDGELVDRVIREFKILSIAEVLFLYNRDAIWFTSSGGAAGAVPGVNGLSTNKSNSLANTLTLGDDTGLNKVIVEGTMTLSTGNWVDYIFEGVDNLSKVNINSTSGLGYSTFNGLDIGSDGSGSMLTTGVPQFNRCRITNGSLGIGGIFESCQFLAGVLVVASHNIICNDGYNDGDSAVAFSALALKIIARGWKGNASLTVTTLGTVDFHMQGGKVEVLGSAAAGNIILSGWGTLTNNTGGATVNTDAFQNMPAGLSIADTEGLRHRVNLDGVQTAPAIGGAAKMVGTDAELTLQSLTVIQTTLDQKAVSFTGNGTGAGMQIFSGTGLGAHGLEIQALGIGGNGIITTGANFDAGILSVGGSLGGHGIIATGGGAGGSGITASGFSGILAQGSGGGPGIDAFGGPTGNGITARSGSTSGHGFQALANGGTGANNGIDAQGSTNNGHGIQVTGQGTGRDLFAKEVGVPYNLEDGTTSTSLTDMLSKMAEIVGAAGTFDRTLHSLQAIATTADTAAQFKKNVAFPNFIFLMVDKNDDKTGLTGLTVTPTIQKDGGSFGPMTNPVIEVGFGYYRTNVTQAEMNGDIITLLFKAAGANDRGVSFPTNV